MISKAADIDAYIAEAPADRQPILRELRALCQKEFGKPDEAIEYGMPCFKRGDVLLVSFASQKGYIAFYGLTKKVIDNHAAELKGLDNGKGCVRWKKPEQINLPLLRTMLREKMAARP